MGLCGILWFSSFRVGWVFCLFFPRGADDLRFFRGVGSVRRRVEPGPPFSGPLMLRPGRTRDGRRGLLDAVRIRVLAFWGGCPLWSSGAGGLRLAMSEPGSAALLC